MGKFLDSIKDEVSQIHQQHDIDQDVTDKVNAALDGKLQPLQDQIDDSQKVIQLIADQLTKGDHAAALETAQTAANAGSAGTEAAAESSAESPADSAAS